MLAENLLWAPQLCLVCWQYDCIELIQRVGLAYIVRFAELTSLQALKRYKPAKVSMTHARSTMCSVPVYSTASTTLDLHYMGQ